MRRVLFAAGGTMGHIGPALAVATSLRTKDPKAEITFVGTRAGLESGMDLGFPLVRIIKVPLPRRFGLDLALFPFRFLIALLQSLVIISRIDTIVGFGGYVSTPLYLAGWLRRRRLIVHEANALPGFANRVGKALGAETYANFENVARMWECEAIGIPLREEVIELARAKQSEKPGEILIMGGSQGSARINEVIWSALERLPSNIVIVHAVGERNLVDVPAHLLHGADPRYRAVGYIDGIAAAYGRAQLVIARAGAVTCAELRALRKRSILIPLGHGNGEQAENAQELVREGIAIAVADRDFTADWLIENLQRAFALESVASTDPHLEATEHLVTAIMRSAARR